LVGLAGGGITMILGRDWRMLFTWPVREAHA
jgi:hypothetical protein